MALGSLRGAALQGLGRVVLGQLPEFFIEPAVFLTFLVVYASCLASSSLAPATAMALRAFSALGAFAFGALLLARSMPRQIVHAKPAYETRRWWASTLPLAVTSGIQVLNRNADILLLSLLASSTDVGIYRVAVQISLVAVIGREAINAVLAPQFVRLYGALDVEGLQRIVRLGARSMLTVGVVVTITSVLAGRQILYAAFGVEYISAFYPLLILLAGQLVNATVGSAGVLLNMTGFERDTTRSVAIAAGLNITLNVVLIPRLGILGVATASAISLSFISVLLWRAVSERLKIDCSAITLVSSRYIAGEK